MKREDAENKFLDLAEGKLSASEAQALRAAINQDPSLAAAWQEYQEIMALELQLKQLSVEVPHGLSTRVMAQVDELPEGGFLRRLTMVIETMLSRKGMATLATACVLVLCLAIVQRSNEAISLRRSDTVATATGPIKAKELPAAQLEVLSPPPAPVNAKKELRVQQPAQDSLPASVIVGVHEPVNGAPAPSSSDVNSALKSRQFNSVPGIARGLANRWAVYDAFELEPQLADSARYPNFGENKRIFVKDQPVSTFSIDVDTASYSNVRRFIQSGHLPPADAVRTEELLNYFSYDYPTQTEKPFGVFYEVAPSPLEQNRFLLKLGIKARDAKPSTKPWNLVFLVDVSGSMSSPNKLDLVKSSLRLLASNMHQGDKVSLVTYANGTGVTLPSTGVEERSKILAAIDSLSAGGGTNGGAGIELAYNEAKKSLIPGGVNRVILATDGDFNVGITNPDELVNFVSKRKEDGIGLTTLGVGSDNLNDSMMVKLADKGDGNYFYLDSFKEARKVFETDLMGTIETVAKDVKLQIEFNPSVVSAYRLIGYEKRALRNEDFHNDAIDAGEIGSGHTVTALYELVLANSDLASTLVPQLRYGSEQLKPEATKPALVGEGPHADELAFLQVRFKEPTGGSSQLSRFPILKQDMHQTVEEASADFKFAAAVAYFGQLLRNSEFKGSYTFDQIATLASSARGVDTNGYRQEFVELVRSAASLTRTGPTMPEMPRMME